MSRANRRVLLDGLRGASPRGVTATWGSRDEDRIQQYEIAFRMQTSIPEVLDLKEEPQSVLSEYGPDVEKPGSFANCLLARRLVEKGVRFIQLYHPGDHHGGLPGGIRRQCKETDQPSAALIKDLKRRECWMKRSLFGVGSLGEPITQGKLTATNLVEIITLNASVFGWRVGNTSNMVYGQTDEFGYNVVDGAVDGHDLHATMLHLMGIDHQRLTYKYQGRNFRLTDVFGRVVKPILA